MLTRKNRASSDLRLQLEKAELDFVVGCGLEASERIHVIDLIENRFVFASAPDGESPDTPIALRDALQSNLIFYGEKSVSWRAARDAAEATRQPLNGEQHVTSIDLWRSLLRQGVGTSITPFGAIAEEVARGEIAVREIADQPIFRRIGIACPIELAAEAWAGVFVDVIVDLVLTGHSRTGTHYRGLDWTW
ncbi:substrate-binding domain-containing protein [Paracoccaceae bacterium Fryx2]|nr:substrate-binding domain-containing protein [Paracoccaceae bacterium Fryx2]